MPGVGFPSSRASSASGAHPTAGSQGLLPQALASHRAAARLWQLEGFEKAPIEILAPRTRAQKGIVVHRVTPSEHLRRRVIRGFPVTTIERTLLDLGAVTPVSMLGRAIDETLIRRLITPACLRAELDREGRKGRPGTAAFRRALDVRFPAEDLAESHLELRFLRLLRRSGLPVPTPQYEVMIRGEFVARLDFAFPELKLAIETHGFRFHGTRERLQADARRENRLKRLGWLILVFTWDDVVGDASRVVSEISEAFAERSEKHLPSG